MMLLEKEVALAEATEILRQLKESPSIKNIILQAEAGNTISLEGFNFVKTPECTEEET